MLECDVLVVGAGPAGASAAYFCAKEGLETVLIEKNKSVGEHTAVKIDSSPNIDIERIIREYDLPIKNHVKLSKWHTPSGNFFTLKSDSGEFYFQRGKHEDSYENIVSRKALENDAQLITGVNDIKVEEKDIFEKVRIKSINGSITIKPKVIIAADGGNSFFHKFVKKEVLRILAGYGISGYDFTSPDYSNIYLNSELLPGGYFYVVTCPDGLSSAGAVVNKSKIKGNIKEHFEKFVRSNDSFSDLPMRSINYFSGFGYIFRIEKHYFKNLLFVGDAGGFIDPLLGYGMTPAILSSYLAYEVIKEGLEGSHRPLDFLSRYENVVEECMNWDSYYQYREIFECMENKDFEWLIDFLNRLQEKIDLNRLIECAFI
jgi:flavin-dependent dehydrogenase